jgi:uncharacterized protein with FMN-binding domain
MRPSQSPALLTLGRAARKLFLSAFVILTFLIYAVHERLAGPGLASASALPVGPQASPTAPAPTAARLNPTAVPLNENLSTGAQPTASQPNLAPATDAPTDLPPSPTATPAPVTGQYKDGQYIGPRVDAFYGFVKVQADIQNGQIADVKFLEFPSDRRTSQRINAVAVPYLTNEAIQAQSANVDIISGATLTSEAFAQSLQAALQSAAP